MVTRFIVAVLIAFPLVAVAGPPIISPGARRFDHAKHTQVLTQSGKPDVVLVRKVRSKNSTGSW